MFFKISPAPRLQIPPDAAAIKPRQLVIGLAVQPAGGAAALEGLEHFEVFLGVLVDSAG